MNLSNTEFTTLSKDLQIRAISVKDLPETPYATWIVTGKKTIETRTWKTQLGSLLICCGKGSKKSSYSGLGLCIVNVFKITPMRDDFERYARITPKDWTGKTVAWFLKDFQVLDPMPIIPQKLSIFSATIPKGTKLHTMNYRYCIPDAQQLTLF